MEKKRKTSKILFKEGILFFPPESEYLLYLGTHTSFIEGKKDGKTPRNREPLPPIFKITCTYSYSYKTVEEETIIDIKPAKDTIINKDLVYEIQEIKNEIKDLGKHLKLLSERISIKGKI